jgi:hypothetical protein
MIVDRRLRRRAGFLSVVGAGLLALALLPGDKPATAIGAAVNTAEIHVASANTPAASVPVVSVRPTSPHREAMALARPVASTPHAPLTAMPDTSTASLPPTAEADTEADAQTGHIGDVAVNVHAGPSNDAEKLAVAQAGEQVAIRGTEGGWVHIVRSDGTSGWVYSSFISAGQ